MPIEIETPFDFEEKVMTDLLCSMKEFQPWEKPGKPWMAVISKGGHPVINPDEECIVLDAHEFDTKDECTAWFAKMQIERPWEKRQ